MAVENVADRTALAAISSPAGKAAFLMEAGRAGPFAFDSSNLSSAVAADTLQGIYVAPASDTTGASGAWVRRFDGPLQVTWYGAVADGVTNDAPAIQAAIDAANAQGGGDVQLPEGTLIINASAVLKPNVVVKGRGMGLTIIKVGVDNIRGFAKHNGGRSGYARIEDLTVWGYHDRNPTLGGDNGRTIVIGPFNEVSFKNVETIYARQMSMTADTNRVTATGCYVHKGARDGMNFTGALYVRIVDNTVEEIGDDAIAVHVSSTNTGTRDESIIIANNRVQKANGIKCLGARNAVISGNHIRFYYGYAVQLGIDATFDEGLATKFDIAVTGNTIADGLNPQAFSGAVINYAIWLNGSRASNSLPVSPGNYDSTSGAFILPAPYVNQVGVGAPRAANFGIVIADNTLVQTLGPNGEDGTPAAVFSDFGFGQVWWHDGYVDPAYTTLVQSMHGVYVTGDWEQLSIVDNVFNGMRSAFRFEPNSVFRNIVCRGNNIFRCLNGFQFVRTSALNTDCVIENNEINLDPYHESSQRTQPLDGSWTVSGTSWLAFDLNWTRGPIIRNNRIRNVMQTARNTNGAVFLAEGNHLFWDWSSGSKGIGNFTGISSYANHHYFVDSNPTSATYLQVTAGGDSAFVRTAVPTAPPQLGPTVSGYFRAGQIVRNSSASIDASNMVLDGWQRLTNGNAHVLGTDWARRYVSHVSPAT